MSVSSTEKHDATAEKDDDSQQNDSKDFQDDTPEDSTVTSAENSPAVNPPLPTENPPPLPNEPVPDQPQDDGWEPVWDDRAQAFYFYNRFTKVSQWENPRVPEATKSSAPGVGNPNGLDKEQDAIPAKRTGGYDPAIHGDYDPNADYAKIYEVSKQDEGGIEPNANPEETYAATGTFNRFTGKWQSADLNPEKFSDENKANRQMNAFFDVDAAANTHDGRSLRAERASKKLSKKELKAFKEKRRERKEEKRRAWLLD